jgi:TPR repeat protein
MKNWPGIKAITLATLLSSAAFAGPMEDAGKAYQRGDYATAMKLIRPLAEKGNVSAEYNLGTMYYNGEGTKRDYAEAMKWYRMAAQHGDVESARRVGFMNANAQGIERNDAEALKWYRMAADKGDPDSQNNLGVIYSTGKGVTQDNVQAHKWFTIAAARFPASEKDKRDKAVKNSELLAKKMKPEEVAQAQKLAREWKSK